MMSDQALIRKYNIPGPRYTSYPTVPYWALENFSEEAWKKSIQNAFQKSNAEKGISLYIHLPFCESLCTYCGCTTRITKNHGVEKSYLNSLLQEWNLYQSLWGKKARLSELHLGGGTPTFFSPENLKNFLDKILDSVEVLENPQFSFEAHPHNTRLEHLRVLYEAGFRRLSLGIQDFDPRVQKLIHREQSFEEVQELTDKARGLGYTSINFDLIYGLPGQTLKTVHETFDKVESLKPERIAFYSYAHVPWLKPAQKSLEPYLPPQGQKQLLYELGKQRLEAKGYAEIGMDHFALKTDELYKAYQDQALHRNFMGYTTCSTELLIGLGASAIGDSGGAMAQNIKKVEAYQEKVEQGEFPYFRGHILSAEDRVIRQHILNLMCQFQTTWKEEPQRCEALYEALPRLSELMEDQLVELSPFELKVTKKGRPFIRNICMTLDAKMWENKPETALFSKTI